MNRFASMFLVLAAVACLWAAGSLNGRLVDLRAEYGLTSTTPLDTAPPTVAFTTVLLGGFRGLIADVLWLRVSALQEQGEYFELVQLSDWITKLEPRSTEIWSFHAWNMAYNVSVAMSEPEDRWRWVQNGIRLLRDEGLVYNAGDPKLYCELGWLYQHKIGSFTDEAHAYYKRMLAVEMTELLGGGRPDYAALAADPTRARRLREDFKLLPDVMQQVEALYGALDWRVAETHAVYWAHRGLMHAPQGESLQCDRMIFQSLSTSFRRGRLDFRPDQGIYVLHPNPDLFESTARAFAEALQRHGRDTIDTAYANFLKQAVLVLQASGRGEKAREIFLKLKRDFPDAAGEQHFEEFLETMIRTGPVETIE